MNKNFDTYEEQIIRFDNSFDRSIQIYNIFIHTTIYDKVKFYIYHNHDYIVYREGWGWSCIGAWRVLQR